MMGKDLQWIKNKYGERMMILCRDSFPKLLETEGLMPSLLEKYFFRNRNLAQDILEQDKLDSFKAFLYSKIDVEKEEPELIINKSAVELFKKVGYILYPECQTEADVQAFRHYYQRDDRKVPVYNGIKPEPHQGEELCTFNGGRLDYCRIWFAVKENINEIKREDFKKPARQDAYGTSVISIQFTRSSFSTLSIKNRYNHKVNNPDNTFNCDLDNIIEGLTDAFERDYGVKDSISSKEKFELDNYVVDAYGKYYPYNYEINNIYYCPNNVIIDHFIPKQLPTHQVLADYFIIDFKNKTVSLYDQNIKDSFVARLDQNEKIIAGKNGYIFLTNKNNDEIVLKLNSRGQITSFYDNGLIECEDNFMAYNDALVYLNLPNLISCGNNFLYKNNSLLTLSLPSLHRCVDNFLYINKSLLEISMPKLQKCGKYFLCFNSCLSSADLSSLESCGDGFMYYNCALGTLNLPNMKECGNSFLSFNKSLKKVSMPNLISCEDDFLCFNSEIETLYMPNLQVCGNNFLSKNNTLEKLSLPSLKKCKSGFLGYNESLKKLNLPALQKCGDDLLYYNNSLIELNAPMLFECGNGFLCKNESLPELRLKKLRKLGHDFIPNNKYIKLDLLQLQETGDFFVLQ